MLNFDSLTTIADDCGQAYRTAVPFPYVSIDGVFDSDVLRECVQLWPEPLHPGWHQHQRGKRCMRDRAQMPARLAALCTIGNSRMFVQWLEAVTGIPKLLADEELSGAGLHEVESGGSLGIHVDFNRLGDLYRRVNVMLYLNEQWEPTWHGGLELRYEQNEADGRVIIQPLFNRLVIFESSERSWHGHPAALKCPAERSRRAVAWYFYTKDAPAGVAKRHSTIYAERKGRKR